MKTQCLKVGPANPACLPFRYGWNNGILQPGTALGHSVQRELQPQGVRVDVWLTGAQNGRNIGTPQAAPACRQAGRATRRAATGYAANLADGSRCSRGILFRLWSCTRACTTLGLNCPPEHVMISRTAAATDRAAL